MFFQYLSCWPVAQRYFGRPLRLALDHGKRSRHTKDQRWLNSDVSSLPSEVLVHMWVERTPEELAKRKLKRRMEHALLAGFFGLFVGLITLFVFGWREGMLRGQFLVPADELLHRLPQSLLFGFVAGLFFFKFKKQPRIVVCPKCGSTKYEDVSTECPCGGSFRNLDEMKWV